MWAKKLTKKGRTEEGAWDDRMRKVEEGGMEITKDSRSYRRQRKLSEHTNTSIAIGLLFAIICTFMAVLVVDGNVFIPYQQM